MYERKCVQDAAGHDFRPNARTESAKYDPSWDGAITGWGHAGHGAQAMMGWAMMGWAMMTWWHGLVPATGGVVGLWLGTVGWAWAKIAAMMLGWIGGLIVSEDGAVMVLPQTHLRQVGCRCIQRNDDGCGVYSGQVSHIHPCESAVLLVFSSGAMRFGLLTADVPPARMCMQLQGTDVPLPALVKCACLLLLSLADDRDDTHSFSVTSLLLIHTTANVRVTVLFDALLLSVN